MSCFNTQWNIFPGPFFSLISILFEIVNVLWQYMTMTSLKNVTVMVSNFVGNPLMSWTGYWKWYDSGRYTYQYKILRLCVSANDGSWTSVHFKFDLFMCIIVFESVTKINLPLVFLQSPWSLKKLKIHNKDLSSISKIIYRFSEKI